MVNNAMKESIHTKISENKMPLLIIEDQIEIAKLIEINLKMLGLDVELIHNGRQGLDAILTQNYSAILLDIMLPEIDGLEICRQARARGIQTPILMLTAQCDELDTVQGLEAGADDYLTKPFSVLELQARVKALLRRPQAFAMPSPASVKSIRKICARSRRVQSQDKEIVLTAREFDILHYLFINTGRVVPREELLNQVWGQRYAGYDHTVSSHINRLRSKLETDSTASAWIKTIRGVGYQYCEV